MAQSRHRRKKGQPEVYAKWVAKQRAKRPAQLAALSEHRQKMQKQREREKNIGSEAAAQRLKAAQGRQAGGSLMLNALTAFARRKKARKKKLRTLWGRDR